MVSIAEARQILGEESIGLTDKQIEELIYVYSLYSRFMIAQHIADKKKSIRESSNN